MKKHDQWVVDEVLRLHREWMSMRAISEAIMDKHWYSIAKTTISDILKRENRDWIDKLNSDFKEHSRYEVEDDNYIFHQKRADQSGVIDRYSIPIYFVDEIFQHYSTYGKDWTQQQCIDHFRIKPWVWSLLKSRLLLTKFSNIVSPVTFGKLEQKWEQEVDKIIYDATYENIQDKHKEKFKKTHRDIIEKEGKKAMKIVANMENFCEYLQDYISWYKPKLIHFDIKKPKNNDTAIYAISDLHLGMKWSDEIVKRMEVVANDIISDDASTINIINLGDLAETLVEWGMHPWQSEDMDWLFWFELMMFVVENFESMLLKIREYKKVSFTGIGWNHDRLLQSHSQDSRRMGAMIIYELIKRWLANTDIEVKYLTDKINAWDIWNLRAITHHWDDWFSNRKPEDILWKHWVPNRQNIIIHGDKHHLTMKEAKNAIMIGTPALASRWTYTKMIDAWSECGYVRIQENEYDTFNVLVRRLP